MTAVTRGIRIGVGVVIAAAAAAAIAGGTVFPWPTIAADPVEIDARPAPAETVLSCPGPLLALGRAADDAGGLSVAQQPSLTAANGAGGEPEAFSLAQPDVPGESAATGFRQLPDGRNPVSAAAASSVAVAADDMSGLASAACDAPRTESWLVGGDTSVGSTGILLLANPGEVNATVRVTVYGGAGEQAPPGADGIPIPAGTQVAMPLAGLAGGEQSPALRVTATGAPVRATLQSSMVRTLDPAGIDVQSAVTPSATQTVTGLRVTGSAAGAEGVTSVLRVLSPNEAATATVTVTRAGESRAVREPQRVELSAGVPVEVGLPDLESAEYTVRVTTDSGTPIVSAVRQQTTSAGTGDYAWFAASPDITGAALIAIPEGPAPRLTFANPADEDIRITAELVDGSGGDELVVPANGTRGIDPDPGTVWRIDAGENTVQANVTLAGQDQLSALPLEPDASVPPPVTVYP